MDGGLIAAHAALGVLALLGLAGAMAAGVRDYRHGRRLSRRYDRALWLVQAVQLTQLTLGIAGLLGGYWPGGVHLVAGSLAVLLPVAVWLVARGRRRVSLALAGACAGAAVVGLTALVTVWLA